MKRVLTGSLLVAALATAGCSGGPLADPSPSPSDPAAATSAAATPDGTASPGAATLPVAQCLTGKYSLVRFVSVGENNTYGTGQGGDVGLSFSGADFTLDGAGKKPIVLNLGGQSADLVVDGTTKGSYAVSGDAVTFTTTETSGSATLQAGKQKQELTMKQVASVVGLNGSAKVACTAQAMTITLTTVRLELGRI